MHVTIVGGNGFIGSHIQDVLLANGISVTVLDRRRERYRPANPAVRTLIGDVADPILTEASLEGAQAVVYCASVTVPQTSAADPFKDVTTNLLPFLSYLGAAVAYKVQRFVFISSGGTVYGVPTQLPVPETHPTNPIVSYGIVKLMMEKYLLARARLVDMEPVILRVGNAYGERQNPFGHFGAISTFLGCYARHQPLEIWGDGTIIRDYLYVRDIAAACLAAVQNDQAEGVYNIGSAVGYSLNQLVQVISEQVGQSPVGINRGDPRPFDIPHIVLDNSLARTKLNWSPRTCLADGIRKTWDWVRTLPTPA